MLVFGCLALVLLLFHVRLTLRNLPTWSAFPAFLQRLRCGQGRRELRVAQKMKEVQITNYKSICKGMAHVVLPTALISLHDALSTPNLATLGTCLALLAAYLHNLAVAAEIVSVTPWRMKIACYLVHTCTLCLAIFTNLSSTDLISFCANKPFLATTRLALLGFVDKSVTIPFNVLFAAVDIGTYFIIFESSVWPSLDSIFLSEISFMMASISASCILEIWVKSRIEALLDTADADTLVSSFQRMLRGVCDGEVLLDSNCSIYGEGKCLQHLIMTTVSLAGKPIARLLVDEERQRFADFIQSSTQACREPPESRNDSCPDCLRVSFRCAAGTRVAVDIYHVPVAGLYGDSNPFHLIAFKEDSECRVQPEAAGPSPSISAESFSRAKDTTTEASQRSVSSLSSASNQAPELKQMALLVDVNTELQDVLEVHMNFQHGEASLSAPTSTTPSGMPSLRRMVRPTDWPRVCSKVIKFADVAFWTPNLKPHEFSKPLAVRFSIHGMLDEYALAQRASIQQVPGTESGSKVWIYLSNFAPYHQSRSRRLQPSLDGIQEGVRLRRREATNG